MIINREETFNIASLARLSLEEGEIEDLTKKFGDVLVYMDKLNQIDTKGVKPTFHARKMQNAFRNDEIKDSVDNSKALFNAPEKEDGCFVVPKVVG